MNAQERKDLLVTAAQVRLGIMEGVYHAKSGHPGGSLSAADLFTYLYFKELRINPRDPKNPDRDRFILSKGHSMEAYYAVLAQKGFLDKEDILKGIGQFGTSYIGHPNNKLPGIEMNSGSLGHGLPVSVGMARAGKMDCRDYRVYVVMGDGELAEGSVWEGAMAASQYRLDNLCAMVDRNRLQISGNTEEIMGLDDLHERFRSFGWHVIDVADGNDVDQLHEAFEEAKTVKGKPTVLIANTVKGKGSSIMENQAGWHHHVPSEEEYAVIMEDLKKEEAERDEKDGE